MDKTYIDPESLEIVVQKVEELDHFDKGKLLMIRLKFALTNFACYK